MPGQADSLGAIPFLSARQGFLVGPRHSSLGSAQGWSEGSQPERANDRVVPGKTEISRLEPEGTSIPLCPEAAHSSSGQDTLDLKERLCSREVEGKGGTPRARGQGGT